MKLTPNEFNLSEESVICASPDRRFEVRVPAYPSGCDYIRVVHYDDEKNCWECVFWNREEFREDSDDEPDTEALGAAMAAVKMVFEGTYGGMA